ncbi:MAG: cohesin domain-containing protein [Elusimicrobiota bacterium]
MNMRKCIQVGCALLSSVLAASAWAAPALTVGTASGQAGTTVNLPISFDPGAASVLSMQFNLTLPPSLSTGTITPGAILAAAGKGVSANRRGRNWTFIVFGLNQNAIGAGPLLTVQMRIAPGAAAGTLNVPVSSVVYADLNGVAINPGALKGGAVTVLAASPSASPPRH